MILPWSPSLVLKHGYGPHWRPRAPTDAQREPDKGETLAHHLVKVRQVLIMRSDGFLVQQALAGDQDAFAVVVHRYSSSLFSYARKFFKDDDQVSDIIQKVFIRLYASLPTLHTDLPLKSWLYQVTHNCCVDELRVNRNHVFHFSELEEVYDGNELPIIEAIPDGDPLPLTNLLSSYLSPASALNSQYTLPLNKVFDDVTLSGMKPCGDMETFYKKPFGRITLPGKLNSHRLSPTTMNSKKGL